MADSGCRGIGRLCPRGDLGFGFEGQVGSFHINHIFQVDGRARECAQERKFQCKQSRPSKKKTHKGQRIAALPFFPLARETQKRVLSQKVRLVCLEKALGARVCNVLS